LLHIDTNSSNPEKHQDDKSEAKQDDESEAKQDDKSKAKQDDESEAKQDDESKAKQDDESEAKQDDESEAEQDDESEAEQEEQDDESDEGTFEIIEEDDPPERKTSMIQYLTGMMRQRIFGPNPTLEEKAEEKAPSDSKNAARLFIDLRAKCKEQAVSQIEQEFTSYQAVRSECARRKLGGNGKHVDLKNKLIKKIAEDKYKSEIADLESKLKNYKPEVEPEDQQEWNDLYQVLRNHESFIDV
jgi:hypothetical protein